MTFLPQQVKYGLAANWRAPSGAASLLHITPPFRPASLTGGQVIHGSYRGCAKSNGVSPSLSGGVWREPRCSHSHVIAAIRSLIPIGAGVSLSSANSEPGQEFLPLTPLSKTAPVRTFSRLVGSSQHAKGQLANCQKCIGFVFQVLSSSADQVGTGGFASAQKAFAG
jgi:hypothetical protein